MMDRRVRAHGQPPRDKRTRLKQAKNARFKREHARSKPMKRKDRSKSHLGYRYTTKVRFRALNLSKDTEYTTNESVKTL